MLLAAPPLLLVLTAQVRPAAASECEPPTTLDQLEDAAARGERAFSELDPEALDEASQRAVSLVSCLEEPLTPEDAAAFHRLMGLAAFVDRDEQRVSAEFHAARKLQPGYSIPEDVAPPGHPLVEAYQTSVLNDEGELQQPYPPVGGWVTVGGVRGAARPSASPVLLQVFEADGDVTETLYLLPGQPLPSWGPSPVPEAGPRLRGPLLASTGGALLASGGLLGVAAFYEDQFWDTGEPRTVAELETLKRRTNLYTWGAVGLGITTAGLATVTVATW